MKKINIIIINTSLITLVAFFIFIKSIDKGEVWRIVLASFGFLISAGMLVMLLLQKNTFKKNNVE